MRRAAFRAATLTPLAIMVASCASVIPDSPPATAAPGTAAPAVPATPAPTSSPESTSPAPANAAALGVLPGPAIGALGIDPARARSVLAAFRLSCPAVRRRTDTSGLTQAGDWDAPCTAASNWPDRDAIAFFESHFAAVQVGDGRAFATGYFEPEIAGSRERRPGYDVPVYRIPDDLVEADLGLFADSLKGRRVRGRVDDGKLVPYHDRTAIETGALAGRGLEIAWAADAAEFFFLQVQGSGRLRLSDGTVMRIGYAGQNGREYVGIGKLLKDRGALGPGQTSMQGILAYLAADTARGTAVMRENPSYIFFRELTGPGPLGALGTPVTGRATVATDPKFTPLGAPVVLTLDRAEANGLWVAQDVGGAIKGANRFDTFWGAGDEARTIAGGMQGRGTAIVLLPLGAAQRLIPR